MRIKICEGWSVCARGITACCHYCSESKACKYICQENPEGCKYLREITIAPVVIPAPTEEELKPGTRVRVTNKYVGEWRKRDQQIAFCNEGTIEHKTETGYEELGREMWLNVSFDKSAVNPANIGNWDCAISELEVIKMRELIIGDRVLVTNTRSPLFNEIGRIVRSGYDRSTANKRVHKVLFRYGEALHQARQYVLEEHELELVEEKSFAEELAGTNCSSEILELVVKQGWDNETTDRVIAIVNHTKAVIERQLLTK